ncbi:MAG: hypothetical protein RML49_08120 [Verrucomicrobiae bacterium]|nr:hypothetical protein [Verrucomicrobiae bacterium]
MACIEEGLLACDFFFEDGEGLFLGLDFEVAEDEGVVGFFDLSDEVLGFFFEEEELIGVVEIGDGDFVGVGSAGVEGVVDVEVNDPVVVEACYWGRGLVEEVLVAEFDAGFERELGVADGSSLDLGANGFFDFFAGDLEFEVMLECVLDERWEVF